MDRLVSSLFGIDDMEVSFRIETWSWVFVIQELIVGYVRGKVVHNHIQVYLEETSLVVG